MVASATALAPTGVHEVVTALAETPMEQEDTMVTASGDMDVDMVLAEMLSESSGASDVASVLASALREPVGTMAVAPTSVAARMTETALGRLDDEALLREYERLQMDPQVSNAKKALHSSGMYCGSMAQLMRVLARARVARAAAA